MENGQKKSGPVSAFLKVWTIVGVALIAAAIVYLLKILHTPTAILLWTAVIVFCLRRPVNYLESKGVKRALGTTIAYVMMFVIITLVALLMFSPTYGISEQFNDLLASIPGYAKDVLDWFREVAAKYAHLVGSDTIDKWTTDVMSSLTSAISSLATVSAQGVVNLGSAIVSSLVIIIFALIIAFWILMQLPAIGRECWRFVNPKRHEDVQMFYVTGTRVMGGFLRATLLQCLSVAVLLGAMFVIMGMPNAIALAGICGVINILPIIGLWISVILATIAGLFMSPINGLIAFIGSILLQEFVYKFLQPKFMQDSVDIHPALTLIALLIGSAAGGALGGLGGSLVGMLAAIPAVAACKSIFVYYFEKNTGRRIVAEDGVFFKGEALEGDEFDPLMDAHSAGPATPPPAKLSDLLPSKGKKDACECTEGECTCEVAGADAGADEAPGTCGCASSGAGEVAGEAADAGEAACVCEAAGGSDGAGGPEGE